MFSKTVLVFGLAATAFASPAPQNTGDLASLAASFTAALGSALPSFDAGSLSSELAAATSLVGALSGLPTLPASIGSVLATAIPSSDLTRTDLACNPTAASWYNALPADVKSALTSYGSAVATWASEHISDLGSYTNVPVCTGAAGKGSSGSGTTSSGSSASAKSTSGSSSGGTAASASGAGAAASSTNSPGAAPRATGAIFGSFVGVVGVLGVMVAL